MREKFTSAKTKAARPPTGLPNAARPPTGLQKM